MRAATSDPSTISSFIEQHKEPHLVATAAVVVVDKRCMHTFIYYIMRVLSLLLLLVGAAAFGR
jgi:hypothetical protein